ncbi:hypothetical protein DNTS_001853 [Danionella cerebrum]|uniref:Translation initiation factor eIF2B subunit gamma n=1 Tax=Danionella cerebrum TaxID=2873325 RepID=A0A553QIN7_9TELE|nr:hypothetical protein DNTS_001853 [Danionella translucida]
MHGTEEDGACGAYLAMARSEAVVRPESHSLGGLALQRPMKLISCPEKTKLSHIPRVQFAVTSEVLLVMELQAVLMAAGGGSRMMDLTYNTPKPLLPVGNRPLIWYSLNLLERVGFEEFGWLLLGITLAEQKHGRLKEPTSASRAGKGVQMIQQLTPTLEALRLSAFLSPFLPSQILVHLLQGLKKGIITLSERSVLGRASPRASPMRHAALPEPGMLGQPAPHYCSHTDILVVSCDLITDVALHEVVDLFRAHSATLSMLMSKVHEFTETVPGQKGKKKAGDLPGTVTPTRSPYPTPALTLMANQGPGATPRSSPPLELSL